MKSSFVNFYDLAILREVLPFLRLRSRILFGRKRRTNHDQCGSVLFVAPCIQGDCLSCLPAVEAFARKYQISYDIVVSPDFKPLAEQLRGVRRVFVAASSYNRITERQTPIRQDLPTKYDLIVVLRLSPAAFGLIKNIKYIKMISSDLTLLKYVIGLVKGSLLRKPVVQARTAMYHVLGLDPPNPNNTHAPVLFTDRNGGRDRVDDLPALCGHERKVLVHPGSGWQVKLWSDDRWVELLKLIHSSDKCRFICIGKGEAENSTFERIQNRLDFKLYTLIDSLDFWELFLVMKRCDLFIGIDSGPRNLAHLADLRSITLLNPAAVNNFMPFDERDIVVEKQNRYPANIINTRRGASLSDISENEVFEAYRRLITVVPGCVRTDSRRPVEN